MTDKQQQQQQKKINLHKLFNLFVLIYSCCYCVILLLLLFCSCGFTITDAEQQQETVTTTTTQSNLHKLFSVQELISPIHIPMYDVPLQQQNMK